MLELELTESQLLDDIDNAISISEQLRALGVKLAIDDFGTGFSSLSYLKRFPVDYVKIDRSFISEVEHSTQDAAITRAIIAMVHSTERRVVAEGVETQAQMDFLKANLCDEIQGPAQPAGAGRAVRRAAALAGLPAQLQPRVLLPPSSSRISRPKCRSTSCGTGR